MKNIEDYLSKYSTCNLKGIAALGILVHHIYQYNIFTNNIIISRVFQNMGYLCVSIFFFCSGYGLMCSSEKEGYIKNFIKRKFIPLYLFYILLLFLYVIYKLFLHINFTYRDLILSITFGKTIVTLGWYLQVTFLLYIIFYIIFNKLNKKRGILLFVFILIIYSIICFLCGIATTWYESVFCFILGMIWQLNKNKIDRILNKHFKINVLISITLFIFSLILSLKYFVIFKILSSIFFVILVIILLYYFKNHIIINNTVFKILGDYSLEIYVSQGFLLLLKKNSVFYINNNIIFIIVVIIGTVIMAYIMKKVYMKINNIVWGN